MNTVKQKRINLIKSLLQDGHRILDRNNYTLKSYDKIEHMIKNTLYAIDQLREVQPPDFRD